MHPQSLLHSLDFLSASLLARLDSYFGAESASRGIHRPTVPDWSQLDSPLPRFIAENKLNREETLLLLLALAPHIQANYFESILLERLPQSGEFPEFGGVKGKQYRGMLPTGETALFALAGNDLSQRLRVQSYFGADHLFSKMKVLYLDAPAANEPKMSGILAISPEYVELFTTGKVSRPHFSAEFPAKLIATDLEWEDLILQSDIKQQIKDLEDWIKHNETLLNKYDMARRLKPGYRVLFHGPSGTGKTMTASLLGKYTGRDVYRIDLSTVVSKYIGETEKNLSSLFDRAEDKNWVLFFDEADALFGKRTGVRDAHDKYANQEVSYLLQRIEEFKGLVILASNFKSNIDDAFMRRFNAVIRFPLPERPEREQIWHFAMPQALVDNGHEANGISNLARQAAKYELTGGNIINIVQYACLRCLASGEKRLSFTDILDGVKREYEKEGRIFSE